MSVKINVTVYRGDQRVDSAPGRPARHMDGDVIGAVYGGLVYPVYEFGEDDLRIDLNDEGIDKDSVINYWPYHSPRVFLSPKSEGVLSLNWYVETNFYGHYLVFDGDEILFNQVLQCLSKNSIEIKRHGESSRRADDGYHYDWFVRLASDDERDEVVDQLSNALGRCGGEDDSLPEAGGSGAIPLTVRMKLEAILAGVNVSDPVEVFAWLSELITSEREEKKKSQCKIREMEEGVLGLENKNSELCSDYLSDKRKFKQQTEILKSEVLTLKEQVRSIRKKNKSASNENNRIDALEIEVSNLTKKLEWTEEESAYVVAEHDKIYKEWKQQSNHLERLEKDNFELSLAVQRSKEKQRSPRRLSPRLQKLIEERLHSFNRLTFPKGTAEVLTAEFEELDGVYEVLSRLDQRENIPANSLTNVAPGWKEVKEHIHTGRNHSGSDMGRIYYRIDPSDSDKLNVVVHHKQDDKEQQRFLERLARQ